MEPDLFFKRKALVALGVNGWTSYDDGSITWGEQVDPATIPTDAQILAKMIECRQQWVDTQYQRQRFQEYPHRDDLIIALWDLVVESNGANAEQIQAMRLAIKEKFPKPGN
jgi:hypothetical protein